MNISKLFSVFIFGFALFASSSVVAESLRPEVTQALNMTESVVVTAVEWGTEAAFLLTGIMMVIFAFIYLYTSW